MIPPYDPGPPKPLPGWEVFLDDLIAWLSTWGQSLSGVGESAVLGGIVWLYTDNAMRGVGAFAIAVAGLNCGIFTRYTCNIYGM